MSIRPADVYKLIGGIEDDLRAANRRMTELRSMLATVNFPKPNATERCRLCGVDLAPGRRILEHLSVVHDDFDATAKLRMLDERAA